MCFGNKKNQETVEQPMPVRPFDDNLAAQRVQPSVSDEAYQYNEHGKPLKERMQDHFVVKSAPGSGGFVRDPSARIGGMANEGFYSR